MPSEEDCSLRLMKKGSPEGMMKNLLEEECIWIGW